MRLLNILIIALLITGCNNSAVTKDKFIENLISKMTLDEKVGQMTQVDKRMLDSESDIAKYFLGSILSGGGAVPEDNTPKGWINMSNAYQKQALSTRLKIPLIYGIDAVHGHNNVVGATVFPHNIGLGCTNDPELIYKVNHATATEVIGTGLHWTFAPCITIPKDDRWGRQYEGFSESTSLVSSLTESAIKGYEDAVSTFNGKKIAACAKHFLGDGGTDQGIDQGNTIISESKLKEIHGTPYYDAIDSCALSIMASFNSWNDKKLHGDRYLLTEILKNQMEFDGFIVGDWNGHGQIPGCEDANCPQALNAGVDIFMVPTEWEPLYWNTLDQVKKGIIPIERLDDAVSRILKVKKHLGLFDKRVPHAYKENYIGNSDHRNLARQAVRESIVLLKNNDVLPMNPKKNFLIIGDQSKQIENQMGGWTITWQGKSWEGVSLSNEDFPNTKSIYESLSQHILNLGGNVEFSSDGSYSQKPDYVIFVYGETPYAEGEGDIDELNFSNTNENLIKLLKEFSKKNISTISLFLTGRPLITDKEIKYSDSFVSIWLPGTAVEGMNDVIFSNLDGSINYDFKGKLSFSWPSTSSDNPLNFNDKNYSPKFEYGYGLTYIETNE